MDSHFRGNDDFLEGYRTCAESCPEQVKRRVWLACSMMWGVSD